jgi:hypothetical protein
MMGLRIVIGGGMARHPIGAGGYTWAFLQYILGLRRLGHQVLYVEELNAAHCVDDDWRPAPFARSANVRSFEAVLVRHGLQDCASLLLRDADEHVEMSRADVHRWVDGADLLVNLSGRLHLAEVQRAVRRRVYVDLDPGFTQIWAAQYGVDMNLAGHDAYATVGLNIGRPDCPVPTLDLSWRPLPAPVVLEEWQPAEWGDGAYTTVADWRGYAPVEWQGVWYKQKADEFLRLIELPRRVAWPLELCLAIHHDEPDLPRLRANGWRLSDPRVDAADSEAYRTYVRRSRGEFSVAKHGYVVGRTGWVSDRTACYLAAGRPAVVQDTGLAAHLPIGEGLLVFTDLESAAAALAEVERDHARHARAAHALARRRFDSDRVLGELLDIAGV